VKGKVTRLKRKVQSVASQVDVDVSQSTMNCKTCDFLAELVVDECGKESIKKSMQCNLHRFITGWIMY